MDNGTFLHVMLDFQYECFSLTSQSAVTKALLAFCDTYARSITSVIGTGGYNNMGNRLLIKVDIKQRVWVRRRRQRSNELRQQKPYPSHGTAYSDALPQPRKGRRRRSRSSNYLHPKYAPVTSSGQSMTWSQNNNTMQQNLSQPIAPTQPMHTQAIPIQKNATPPGPVPQEFSQQSTTGMDVAMARTLLQDL